MTHDDGVAYELPQLVRYFFKSRGIVQCFRVDSGEAFDSRGQGAAGVDQAVEAAQIAFRLEANGADFEDDILFGIEPCGLRIQSHVHLWHPTSILGPQLPELLAAN